MKQLFPDRSTTCKTSNAQNLGKTTPPPTIQAVIAKNEQIIDAVSAMLQCSCTQDGYLLNIMSLIVFKVLGWYAAAARTTPSSGRDQAHQLPITAHDHQKSCSEQVVRDSTKIGSYSLEGEDSARMAAQLVLSELHRVQQLVNKLSTKLRTQETKDAVEAGTHINVSDQSIEMETSLPLSNALLDQLGKDLKKRLKSLSLEIVEALRRG